MSRQRNRIGRIFRADVHLQLEVHKFFAVFRETARNLVHTRRLSRLDCQILGLHAFDATFGSVVSGVCSTGKFKLSATMATDSGKPTCLITPAFTCARNSSTVMPAPIFFCNGKRRVDASTTRNAFSCSMRCEIAAR